MPSELKHLRILLASPSDVVPERDAVHRVVAELNRTFPAAFGVLDILAWETHSTPALGRDPQAILNEQLGDDYDIFIGILWSRLGTPTPRADSGTVEEFQRAHDRWMKNPSSVSVMFYFKTLPISPFDVDPDQLRKVQLFKASLENTAVTATFKTPEELEAHLRVHLTRQIFAWVNAEQRLPESREMTHNTAGADTGIFEEEEGGEEEGGEEEGGEEEGLLDLVEKGNVAFQVMTASAKRMAEEIQELGTFFTAQAEKIRALDASQSTDAKKAKQLINRTAERMRAFARRVDKELPLLRDSAVEALRSVGKAAQLAPDFGPKSADNIDGNLVALQQLRPTIATARQQLLTWRKTVEEMPRVTTRFNAAKREVLSVLDRLDQEFALIENLGAETERMIDQVLQKLRVK